MLWGAMSAGTEGVGVGDEVDVVVPEAELAGPSALMVLSPLLAVSSAGEAGAVPYALVPLAVEVAVETGRSMYCVTVTST